MLPQLALAFPFLLFSLSHCLSILLFPLYHFSSIWEKEQQQHTRKRQQKIPQTEKAECLKMTRDMTYITSKPSFTYKGILPARKSTLSPPKWCSLISRPILFQKKLSCITTCQLAVSCLIPILSSLGLCETAPKNGSCPSEFHFP